MFLKRASHIFRFRLWLVSLEFFAAGLIGRWIAEAYDYAATYPISLDWQWHCYGVGLLIWIGWIAKARSSGEAGQRGLIWFALAFASFMAILSTTPK